MRGPGPASAAIAVVALLMSTIALAGTPAVARPPSPSPSAQSPAPTFTLTTRSEASDDRFRLTIETDEVRFTTHEAIEIRTTWAYLGTEPVRICTGSGGPVIFVVEQLDGSFDPGGGGDDSGRIATIQPGTVSEVPFQKSGGYNASDPMAPQYAAWFDDPVLHLPAGVFRITAHAQYAVHDCGAGTTLEASVVIEVAAAPGASPSPSAAPVALWTPIDLDLLPWDYRCFQRFDPSALAIPGGIPTDDADLAAIVRGHGPDSHLLMVDERFALIGEPVGDRPRARDPLYQYQLERWEGDGPWVWSAEGDCHPLAELADPPAIGGHWRLDPAFPAPISTARVIHALVVYRGCPSAVRLRGKPRVVTTKDAVAAVVPVVNAVNSDACSPGTPTPVTIRLPEPLGDRALYDAGVLPMRRVRVR